MNKYYKKWMLGLRLSWEDEREKHNSWKRPRACGTLRFHELCFSLSSSHESRKPNIHFLNDVRIASTRAWTGPRFTKNLTTNRNRICYFNIELRTGWGVEEGVRWKAPGFVCLGFFFARQKIWPFYNCDN